jgi:hypothetical protein
LVLLGEKEASRGWGVGAEAEACSKRVLLAAEEVPAAGCARGSSKS